MTDPLPPPPPPVPPPAGRRPPWLVRLWRDPMLQKIFRNTGKIVSGEAGGAVFNVIAIALTARDLGPALFGALVLIQAYVKVVNALIRFQTWQILVKFGSEALAAGDNPRFRRLVGFCNALDWSAAVVATALAVAAADVVGRLLGWPDLARTVAPLLCLRLLFTVTATPVGALRLFDRFDLIAWSAMIGPAVRLAATLAVFGQGAGLEAYVWILLAAAVAERGGMLFFGWRELARQGHGGAFALGVRGAARENPGIWGFAWSTNIIASFSMAAKEADLLIIGAVLGPAAAGLYRIASDIARGIAVPGNFLMIALFPELAKLWATDSVRDFRRLLMRVAGVAVLFALAATAIVTAAGGLLLELFAGKEYVAAHLPLVVLAVAMTIGQIGVPFDQALAAMGRIGRNLKVTTVSTFLAVPGVAVGAWAGGLLGASFGRLAVEILAVVLLATAARAYIGRRLLAAPRAGD